MDALRGGAIVWMTTFHFCFDLAHFGYLRADFYADALWTMQRTAIVSLFLFCAGLGQAIAVHQGQGWPRFWRRWRRVAGCALLVTLGSMLMFPRSFIYFGVLHGLAAMLVVVRCTAGWGRWLWLVGAFAIAMPFIAASALSTSAGADFSAYFDAPMLNWLGLVTRKPITEDYVPVLPWLGVMWWGMAAGEWLLRTRSAWLAARLPRMLAPLALLGRWSLPYYMLHQLVLMGALTAWGWVAGR
ncbi:DUF1624 domain-containing protein [Ramlibacter sp. H39-3-26]|uniref:DUF1624 domain-containing protein n=1 Tax=Curvibacter soli TaxID=3031331 RepID=UPI0023D9CB79|nr:heparan-alpha-glucosaminide N-acetyltransferase [Ramlibacter sp. H39-3-26]